MAGCMGRGCISFSPRPLSLVYPMRNELFSGKLTKGKEGLRVEELKPPTGFKERISFSSPACGGCWGCWEDLSVWILTRTGAPDRERSCRKTRRSRPERCCKEIV